MNILPYQLDKSLVSNAFGFMRFPVNFTPFNCPEIEWVITGIPFDITTSGRAGSRHAPGVIRHISVNLAWEQNRWPWSFDIRKILNIVDCGDLIYNFGDVQDLSMKLQIHTEKLLTNGKRSLSIGGDHFITLPILRAHVKFFGKIILLHFDAHSDCYQNHNPYDHGTIFYHAIKENLIDPKNSVQIGIRTESYLKTDFTIFNAGQVNDCDVNDILRSIKRIVGSRPVYLTFDIDCLDPAFAPGTGTPVIGGLTTDKALKLIRGLKGINIVGMDVVEVSPPFDHSEITSLAAATLALEMLHVQAATKLETNLN
ncbi:MAG: agmatinase [Candidatus Dasytiphilus stammeri]